jgi:hypothetical protein
MSRELRVQRDRGGRVGRGAVGKPGEGEPWESVENEETGAWQATIAIS